MNARDILAVFAVLASLETALGWQIYDRYPRIHLEQRCNGTVYLPCPSNSYSQAGTLSFFADNFWIVDLIPKYRCEVFVGFEDGCEDINALYLNVRKFVVPNSATIRIYEIPVDNATAQANKLVKQMGFDSNLHASDAPASIGQLLSQFGSSRTAPVFEIDLQTSGFWSPRYKVEFDYTIVRKRGSYSDIYCEALRGYVPNDFCQLGYAVLDRLMCPSNYHSTVYPNPAYGFQACDPEPTANAISDVRYDRPRGLNDGAMVALVIGVGGGTIIMSIVLAFIKDKIREYRKNKTRHLKVLEAHRTARLSVIMGPPYPPMYQQGPYAPDGQPPPYPAQAHAAPPLDCSRICNRMW